MFLRSYVFHEVRVPLNSISMSLSLIEDEVEDLSSEAHDMVNMMKEASHFMSETLNDVLSLQKIEDDQL
jgi:signal transduction histidine kinase